MKAALHRILVLLLVLTPLSPAFGDGSPCGSQEEELKRTIQKASRECREAVLKADKCCRQPKSDGCGFKETTGVPNVLPTEGSYGAAVQQTGRLVKAKNENNEFAAICSAGHRKADSACADEAEKPNREIRTRAFKKYEKCHTDQAEQNSREINESLKSANESMSENRWRVVCDVINIQNSNAEQCMLYNDGNTTGSIISGAERDNQEMTAVPLGRCSGYTDPNGALYTAAHCPGDIQTSTMEKSNGDMVTGAWRDHTVMNANLPKSDFTPYKYDDQAAYRPLEGVNENNFDGKPFYTLAHDPAMNSGCAVRGSELACSGAALAEIQGTQAKIQGYPGTYFAGDTPYLNQERDQVLTEGPAYYEPNTGQMRVVANAQPGSSGGPTYFPSQTTIGGVTSDRPIVVGPTASINNHPEIGGNNYSLSFNRITTKVPVIATGAKTIRPQSIDDILLKGGALFKNPPKK